MTPKILISFSLPISGARSAVQANLSKLSVHIRRGGCRKWGKTINILTDFERILLERFRLIRLFYLFNKKYSRGLAIQFRSEAEGKAFHSAFEQLKNCGDEGEDKKTMLWKNINFLLYLIRILKYYVLITSCRISAT